MKIVLLAEHALMNVLLKQYQKVIFIKLIRTFAPIVVPVLMSARLRQFIPNNITITKDQGAPQGHPFLLWIIFCLFKYHLNICVFHQRFKSHLTVF